MARQLPNAPNGSSDGASTQPRGKSTQPMAETAPNGSSMPTNGVPKIRRKKKLQRPRTPSPDPDRTPTPPLAEDTLNGWLLSPEVSQKEKEPQRDWEVHVPDSSHARVPATYDDADSVAKQPSTMLEAYGDNAGGVLHLDTPAEASEAVPRRETKRKRKHTKSTPGDFDIMEGIGEDDIVPGTYEDGAASFGEPIIEDPQPKAKPKRKHRQSTPDDVDMANGIGEDDIVPSTYEVAPASVDEAMAVDPKPRTKRKRKHRAADFVEADTNDTLNGHGVDLVAIEDQDLGIGLEAEESPGRKLKQKKRKVAAATTEELDMSNDPDQVETNDIKLNDGLNNGDRIQAIDDDTAAGVEAEVNAVSEHKSERKKKKKKKEQSVVIMDVEYPPDNAAIGADMGGTEAIENPLLNVEADEVLVSASQPKKKKKKGKSAEHSPIAIEESEGATPGKNFDISARDAVTLLARARHKRYSESHKNENDLTEGQPLDDATFAEHGGDKHPLTPLRLKRSDKSRTVSTAILDADDELELAPPKRKHSRKSRKRVSTSVLDEVDIQAEIAASQDQGGLSDTALTHQRTAQPEKPSPESPTQPSPKQHQKKKATVSWPIGDYTVSADSAHLSVLGGICAAEQLSWGGIKRNRKGIKRRQRSSLVASIGTDSEGPMTKTESEGPTPWKREKQEHESVEIPDEFGKIRGTRRPRGANFDGVLGAKREIQNVHRLSDPPLLLKIGPFSADEKELLRQAIVAYMEVKGYDLDDMVRVLQYVSPSNVGKFESNSREAVDRQAQGREAKEFWKEMRAAVPTRDNVRIQRYVRRTYHNFEKGGGNWTDEEDTNLRELQAAYPNQWARIAAELGSRGEQDCRDRWRNYLQYGNTMNSRRWNKEEESALAFAYMKARDTIQEEFAERDVHMDEYEISNYVNWTTISQAIGGTRSRLQCLTKWKQIGPEWGTRRYQPPETPRASLVPRSSMTPIVHKTLHKREHMLWGDKLDLIAAIAAAIDESEDRIKGEGDIDWEAIAPRCASQTRKFLSNEDRKIVLKELLDIVGPPDGVTRYLRHAIGDMLEYIEKEHGDEAGGYYDPYLDFDVHSEEEYVESSKGSKSKMPWKTPTAKSVEVRTPRPSSSKASRPAAKPSKFKSKEIITVSDDDDGDEEL
ncbi:hypothetical protein P154DRAFT_615744 [Amniculicola lignicola CBS 123094]|uniref:Uncharacterized protein n=1 Tax=Amniculicola lignicola CBS 123094 TaxID=1392246 RepID=A0A6A5WXD5_9PLEO|nr:hypothetical protein P154DRAFT_615744 [Amniculicola lignicola CBS 123094]